MPTDSRHPNIAIFGGSFNPPHRYHLAIGLHVLEHHDIDEVWYMPVQRHALGKQSVPFADRMAMVSALIAPHRPRLSVMDFENRHDGPSYTIDTLKALQETYPDHAFSLILGTDIREETERWKDFDIIERDYPIIWIGREGHKEEGCDVVMPDISSTLIRDNIAKGIATDDYLTPEVLEEISLRNLYQPE